MNKSVIEGVQQMMEQEAVNTATEQAHKEAENAGIPPEIVAEMGNFVKKHPDLEEATDRSGHLEKLFTSA